MKKTAGYLFGKYSLIFILLFSALCIIYYLLNRFAFIFAPLAVGLLLFVFLYPVNQWLKNKLHIPPSLSSIICVIALLAAMSLVVWVFVLQITPAIPEIYNKSKDIVDEFASWVHNNFGISIYDTDQYLEVVAQYIKDNVNSIVSYSVSIGENVFHLAGGIFLAVFIIIFLLSNPYGVNDFIVNCFPKNIKPVVRECIKKSFFVIRSYIKVQVLVAIVDAVGISICAAILGLPFVIPFGIIVFVGSFIPYFGAIISGCLFCLIALIYKGPIIAIIMLACIIGVQQGESHILQPLISGKIMKLHPLGVLISVVGGTLLFGALGAFLAIPFIASLYRSCKYIKETVESD